MRYDPQSIFYNNKIWNSLSLSLFLRLERDDVDTSKKEISDNVRQASVSGRRRLGSEDMMRNVDDLIVAISLGTEPLRGEDHGG